MSALSDQTWLLLGASGGIGGALLDRLLDAGATVIVTARKSTTSGYWAGRERVIQATLDLSADNLGEQLKALLSEYGVPDGVIHCAGVNRFVDVEGNDDRSLNEMLNVNLRSPMVLARELTPAFRRRGHGTYLFVGSTFGSIGYPGYSAYCASKFGLRGFVEALRRELADTDIRVRYVAPRATRTTMNGSEVEALNEALGNHMDAPDTVAAEIMATLGKESRRACIFIGWPEKLFVRINALLPLLVDKALSKQLPIIQHYLKDRTP
ncbi:MAG: SDR family oxidoreductase [Alcanivorax sp.]|uniref:Short chain dehydrogenase n=1 Tax=Alloalcanivorax venustensis ISO4 TaxID=1177184 RepID=A0ABS0AGF8_9GAMM|nr:SDR family oxidoreductase [Alloalcanivorax venustensis]MBF5053168.1 short chain dehydrogenase [Alloalcanivorax venustensis ISO4]MBL4714097.1 SDR family oxidoreductase [Alcanivorax sp.]